MAVSDRWHTKKPRVDPGTSKPVPPCEHSRGGAKLFPSTEHGQGKRYLVRWRDPEGQPKRRSFTKKTGADPETCAEAWDAEVKAALNSGTYTDPGAGKITLAEYAMQWRESRSGDLPTLSRIDSALKVHIYGKPIGGQPMAMLAKRPSMVQQWIKTMSGLEPITVRTVVRILSSIFIAAVDDGVVPRNPTRVSSVRAPKVVPKDVVPWTLERVVAAREAMPAEYGAMADLGAGCGMRQGEMFGLDVDEVDFLGRTVRVVRQVRLLDDGSMVFAPPKGGRNRTLPLPEHVGLQLAAHIAAHPPVEVTLPWVKPGGKPHTAQLMFVTTRRGALHRNAFNADVWRPARIAAGAPDTRAHGMHVLRHTAASAWLAAGVDIRTVAAFLGHADAGFTLRTYAHLMPDASDRARKAMDEFFDISERNALKVPGEGSR